MTEGRSVDAPPDSDIEDDEDKEGEEDEGKKKKKSRGKKKKAEKSEAEKKKEEEEKKKREEYVRLTRTVFGDAAAAKTVDKEAFGQEFFTATMNTVRESGEQMTGEEVFVKLFEQYLLMQFLPDTRDPEEQERARKEIAQDAKGVLQERDQTKREERKKELFQKYKIGEEKAEAYGKFIDLLAEAWAGHAAGRMDPNVIRQQLGSEGLPTKDKLKNWFATPGGIIVSLLALFSITTILALQKAADLMMHKKKGK